MGMPKMKMNKEPPIISKNQAKINRNPINNFESLIFVENDKNLSSILEEKYHKNGSERPEPNIAIKKSLSINNSFVGLSKMNIVPVLIISKNSGRNEKKIDPIIIIAKYFLKLIIYFYLSG